MAQERIPELIFEPDHKDLQTFWKLYDTEQKFHSSQEETKASELIFWGEKNNRVCRFCKRESSSTTFKSDAHLIPEMMGNKLLFSFYECDKCNSIFSTYENELA